MKEEYHNWSTVTVHFYLHWIAGIYCICNDLFITFGVHVISIFYFIANSCSQRFPNRWLLLVIITAAEWSEGSKSNCVLSSVFMSVRFSLSSVESSSDQQGVGRSSGITRVRVRVQCERCGESQCFCPKILLIQDGNTTGDFGSNLITTRLLLTTIII